ncbi:MULTISPECIES: hypothetical protein [Burkholderia]|uniref:hypothetical protein n=1 Tax=Burkholderia TaxID=32008 RepID=UPI000531EBD9|nr:MULTISPECIES: hypothetical protein [Burkholderia]KGS04675.1 putative oxidoreductase [Burkholderia sp. ABCPW 111]
MKRQAAPDIEGHGGAMFDGKRHAILPSPGLTGERIRGFAAAPNALLARTGARHAAP